MLIFCKNNNNNEEKKGRGGEGGGGRKLSKIITNQGINPIKFMKV